MARKILARIFDPRRGEDYVLVQIFAALPIFLSFVVGADLGVSHQGMRYEGYLERVNWVALPFILPVELLLLRLAVSKIAPVHTSVGEVPRPPLAELLSTEELQDRTHGHFLARVPSSSLLFGAVTAALLLNLIDSAAVFSHYLGLNQGLPNEPDWTVLYLTGKVAYGANLLLVISAYLLQFAASVLILLFLGIMLRNNLFFLDMIFQRRRLASRSPDELLVIDLEDPDQCFGFKKAHKSFNTQVKVLFAVGAVILFSRFANIDWSFSRTIYESIDLGDVWEAASGVLVLSQLWTPEVALHDVGQWILAIGWLLLFGVVSLPALVKMLPLFKKGKNPNTITAYLREFLPDEIAPWGDDVPVEEINKVAKKFASNAFWPTGDNQAKVLFFFSFWVFLVILLPLEYRHGFTVKFIYFYAYLAVLAYILSTVTLKALEFSLRYIDKRLVIPDS